MCSVCTQVMYHNAEPLNGYDVTVTTTVGRRRDMHRVIASCRNSLDYINRSASSARENYKYKSCYTGALARLSARNTVSIENKRRGSLVSANSTHTFIGFIKLSADH